MAEDDSAPIAAAQTWRAHLCTLTVPEGYDTVALFGEIEGGSRPLVAVVDPEALTRASTDPEIAAAIKALGAGRSPAS